MKAALCGAAFLCASGYSNPISVKEVNRTSINLLKQVVEIGNGRRIAEPKSLKINCEFFYQINRFMSTNVILYTLD